MTLLDGLKLSVSVLRSNKMRSFLTSLGIIIGIAAVIVIISVGAGAQSLIINQLNSVGTNLIGILPGASDENGPPASALGIVVTTLKYEDALAIKKQVQNITAVSSYNSGVATLAYQGTSVDANFNGVMSDYPNVEDTEIMVGRFFTPEEESESVRAVVLGYQVYHDLFGSDNALGKRVKIKKESFEVIGVMKERGTSGFQSQDDIVLMPVSTAQKIMLGVDYVNYIRVKINYTDNLDRATEDIKFLLRDRHNIGIDGTDDFSVRNTKDAIDTLLTITDALKFFLAAIAAISLIVGGVGVMNIMLAAVSERVREIGLRKAVGARRVHIITQFVLETMAITIIGGIIGIIIGFVISAIIAFVANYLGYKWDFVVSLSSILLGTSVAAVIGLVFGIYPAQKAARLDPIEALRYE